MNGQRRPQPNTASKKGKTPAERAEEFSAAQQKMKQEAADRRETAARDAGSRGNKPAA